MKITVKQYALALYEAIEGKSAAQAKIAIKNFVEFLALKNQLAKGEKIAEEFIKLWREKNGIVAATVASASELDRETGRMLKKHLAEITGAKEVIIEEKVDKSLLGGVVIKYGDKLLDGSLKNSLADFKDKLIK